LELRCSATPRRRRRQLSSTCCGVMLQRSSTKKVMAPTVAFFSRLWNCAVAQRNRRRQFCYGVFFFFLVPL
jgi:hypothetical protein